MGKQKDMWAPPIIGIAGPKGSGKDAVGHLLQGFVPCSEIVKFAGPLKRMTASFLENFGISADVLEDPLNKERVIPDLGVSARDLMITLGTEWGRNMVHEDVWIKAARAALLRLYRQGITCVVTDVRFVNEAHLIRQLGGVVWQVTRPGVGYSFAHPSECPPPKEFVDYYIHNDGDLEDLHFVVARAWAEACRVGPAGGVE